MSTENTTETKRGRGRPRAVQLPTLLTAFDTLKEVTVPILVETLGVKTSTAFATIKRGMQSQWVKRIARGKYALTVKGEQKAQQFA